MERFCSRETEQEDATGCQVESLLQISSLQSLFYVIRTCHWTLFPSIDHPFIWSPLSYGFSSGNPFLVSEEIFSYESWVMIIPFIYCFSFPDFSGLCFENIFLCLVHVSQSSWWFWKHSCILSRSWGILWFSHLHHRQESLSSFQDWLQH